MISQPPPAVRGGLAAEEATVAPPAPRQTSVAVRETMLQLAEVTERYTQTNDAPALPPSDAALPATAHAVTAPRVQLAKPTQRDMLALAAMARVRARAEAQHLEALDDGAEPLPQIDPHDIPAHACTPLHLPGVGAASSKGTRAYQQDVAMADWLNPHAFPIAAVCDGHGIEAAADVMPWHWLQQHLIDILRAHLPAPHDEARLTPHVIYRSLIRAIDGSRARPRPPLSVVEQMDQVNAVDNGTTLTAAVRIADAVYIANVGDSRAILVGRDGRVQQLTVDHKIDQPDEWNMVQGRVLAGEASMAETSPGVYRMLRHARDGAVYGIGMSRSIGDDQATVSRPDISMFHVTSDDIALVLCSDGVFDIACNEQVAHYVSAVMSRSNEAPATLAQHAADGLVGWCHDTETAREKSQASIDNLTALVLPLHRQSTVR